MKLTLAILSSLEEGEVFRIVTTKIQRIYNPMKSELTFVCKKGHGHNDWAIYCHHSYQSLSYIESNGDKVTSEDMIQSICPCDDEAMQHYRH
jgi:hypothetical protein